VRGNATKARESGRRPIPVQRVLQLGQIGAQVIPEGHSPGGRGFASAAWLCPAVRPARCWPRGALTTQPKPRSCSPAGSSPTRSATFTPRSHRAAVQDKERAAGPELRLTAYPAVLRIKVFDTDPQPPRPRIPDELDESGFGFVLARALAGDWGSYPAATGKAVWADVPIHRPPGQAHISAETGGHRSPNSNVSSGALTPAPGDPGGRTARHSPASPPRHSHPAHPAQNPAALTTPAARPLAGGRCLHPFIASFPSFAGRQPH